jgi:dihydroorotate dehydrogenase
LYKLFIKPILFKLDPEKAHTLVFRLIAFVGKFKLLKILIKKSYTYHHPKLQKELFGLRFKNPVGLAAGFDKNGQIIEELDCLGFGFIEVGTVTPLPQVGNEKPRLFRLPKDNALINRMGFNNEGVDALVEKLKKIPKNIIIGGNIGKNKTTPNESAIDDYKICFEKLFDWVNYFVVNVSSPNTPNLRALQDKEPLKKLLTTLNELNFELAGQKNKGRKPILLKIAPDLTNAQLDDIIDIIFTTKIDGIVATNTTINRCDLNTDSNLIEKIGAGGLSGFPLKKRSTEVISYLSTKSNKKIPIIGVGGINNSADVKEKLSAGACLVQIYSGYVYEGPNLVSKICKDLI